MSDNGSTKRVLESIGPKFLIDGMLGSLAVKLRILGFDTLYDKQSEDKKLITEANADGRILVTSDKELFANAKQKHGSVLLITGCDEKARLIQILQGMGIARLDSDRISRCSNCNSLLLKTNQKDKLSREIYICSNCKKSYWHGSHWKKLNALFSEVNNALAETRRNNRD